MAQALVLERISQSEAAPSVSTGVSQALLGFPQLSERFNQGVGRPLDVNSLSPNREAASLDPRLGIIGNAVCLSERIGMTPDEINESFLPVIDGIVSGKADWKTVRRSLKTLSDNLTHGSFQDLWGERLEPFTELALQIAGHLGVEEVAECERLVRDTIYQSKPIDAGKAAQAAVRWYDAKPYSHIALEDQPKVVPTFLRDLLFLVDKEDFDQMGALIMSGEFKKEDFTRLPDVVVERMLDCFKLTGFVSQRESGALRLTNQGHGEMDLGYDEIKGSLMALDNIAAPKNKPGVTTFESLQTDYVSAQKAQEVEVVHLELNKPTNTVLYLSEILLGENTADIGFLNRTIDTIAQMPPERRPNTIIVSGLIDGGFKYREKAQRAGLVLNLDAQLAGAKVILERLKSLGATVIYNMSDRDREVCRDGTIDAMSMMVGKSKKMVGGIPYWQQDQLQQNPAWDKHHDFWINAAFEYCLRSGRSLRTASEMAQATKGKVRIDEYLVLYDVFQRQLQGQAIPDSYRSALEMDNIPFSGKKFNDYRFVDDVNLTTTFHKGRVSRDVTEWVRHNLNFGPKPMYQSPTVAAESIIQQGLSEGIELPDRIVNLHQQEGRVVGKRETDVITTPSFLDPMVKLQQRGSASMAGQTAPWRELMTRRRISRPGALMVTDTLDYRTLIDIFNKKLLDKATVSPDREVAAFIFDLQAGSITSRPDYFIKLLHMIGQKLEQGISVHLFSGGDVVQGWNYKTFPVENAGVGLIPIDAQTAFVSQMIRFAFEDLSPEALTRLKEVRIVTGNHEINSGSALNGAHHTAYLDAIFKELFLKAGILKPPVSLNDTVLTPKGELFKEWVAMSQNVAGYGVMVRHMPLEKNGGKGGGGSPIDGAAQFLAGVEDLSSEVDALVTGHWHQKQMGVFGDKVAVTAPSLAGESGYEFVRGYRPNQGAVFLNLGGGLPPEVEFLSERTFQQHKITDGWFSDKHLRSLKFTTDHHFDPGRNGFAHRESPHNALQKVLWKFIDDIVRAEQTTTRLK